MPSSYMVSPKARSDVEWIPGSNRFWSVPDVYSAQLGAAFAVLPEQGLTMSLGGRIDGIPIHDLIGGGDDDTIKRTAYVIFADPGLSYTRGPNILTLSVPYRLAVNRQKSLFEQKTNALNGGGLRRNIWSSRVTLTECRATAVWRTTCCAVLFLVAASAGAQPIAPGELRKSICRR